MRRRPAIPRWVAVLLLAGSLAVVTGPAQADGARLLVAPSAAGPFAAQMSEPLLAGIGRVVPLDTAGDTFYVKNSSSEVARTTVSVVNRGAVNDLTDALTVTVDVAGTAATGTLPPRGRRCDLVITGPQLRPGGVQPVEVALAVGDLVGQRGVREQLALDVDVTLSPAGAAGAVATCGEQAAAEPPAADCERTAVVTLTGAPRCVPSAIDAGLDGRPGLPREPAAVAGAGLAVLVFGALLLLTAHRRRRTAGTAPGA